MLPSRGQARGDSNGQNSKSRTDSWRRALRRLATRRLLRRRRQWRPRRLVEPPGGALGRGRRLPDRRGALPPGLRANPNSVDALVGLGRSYAGMGQYARAEQALNEANRRKPKDPAVLLELARTQLGAGQAASGARQPRRRAVQAAERRRVPDRERHRPRSPQPARRGPGGLSRGTEARPDRLRAPEQPRPVARPVRADRRRHRHPARPGARRRRHRQRPRQPGAGLRPRRARARSNGGAVRRPQLAARSRATSPTIASCAATLLKGKPIGSISRRRRGRRRPAAQPAPAPAPAGAAERARRLPAAGRSPARRAPSLPEAPRAIGRRRLSSADAMTAKPRSGVGAGLRRSLAPSPRPRPQAPASAPGRAARARSAGRLAEASPKPAAPGRRQPG